MKSGWIEQQQKPQSFEIQTTLPSYTIDMLEFLAEMKASIQDVRDRIEELNRALRDNRFGTERFSFQITENPDYKRFYDMINDPMLMESYNLMSQQFLDKHGPAAYELFSRIVDLAPLLPEDPALAHELLIGEKLN